MGRGGGRGVTRVAYKSTFNGGLHTVDTDVFN